MVPGKLADEVVRRRQAAEAGHRGDEPTARRLLVDPEAKVRATALGALARMDRLTADDVALALTDAAPVVRRRAAELAVPFPLDVARMLLDPDVGVVEVACWALGEQGAKAEAAVPALAHTAGHHADPLCREAAVAALGAIGCDEGLPAILAATTDRPTVRRRAVLALAPFDGPEVDAALQRAAGDRDWQVRQAAEDLLADD
ncbi:MAG: hypothetical protein QOG64_86 [Acidimicrobiaceae bacterium]|nr:hypothetical protein [Acidimicrobiaceae bacterium]